MQQTPDREQPRGMDTQVGEGENLIAWIARGLVQTAAREEGWRTWRSGESSGYVAESTASSQISSTRTYGDMVKNPPKRSKLQSTVQPPTLRISSNEFTAQVAQVAAIETNDMSASCWRVCWAVLACTAPPAKMDR